ncbi:Hsp70 family protein, partial [Candidatus Sumerlaeota bacterium]|nr:Hsp70 family protein [Candidatus Sumerlaeota bacterium]
AGKIAGLEVKRIINEPTAAALAYGLGREGQERVAVFDFGGGTFDITLLEIDDDVFEVRATSGDNFLGGDNLDEALTQWICDEIVGELGIDPRGDCQAHQRVRDTAEKIKCELSTLTETTINLPFIVADESGPKHFVRQITRGQLEGIIEPLLERIIAPCRQVLRDANVIPADIDTVLLVGGSTRIPRVRQLAADIFGREPNRTVNPDEVVALGASIQASILSGDIEEVLLLDVTPLSLGIELEGGLMKTLIPRNSSIPTTASRTFTTSRDNQRAVSFAVLQGERKIARENRELAKLRLAGVRPAPREVPEIEVTFHIDANGILNVSAEDLSTAARQEITVESIAALAPEEIERMIHDSEVHAREDAEFTQAIEAREQAIHLRDRVESFVDLHSGEIGADEEREIRETLLRLDLAAESNDPIGLYETRQALMQFVQRHSDLFYLHSVSASQSAGNAEESSGTKGTPPSAAKSAETQESAPEDSAPGN